MKSRKAKIEKAIQEGRLKHFEWGKKQKRRCVKERTPAEWVLVAEKLARENDDKVPSSGWLQENGYPRLCQVMREYPELFSHLQKEYRGGRTPEEWVPVAESVFSENGEKLPYGKWLEKNGYSGLCAAMRKHPELFSHLKQENRKGKIPEDRVEEAERLASENGGKLPYGKWLLDNGYSELAAAMRRRPELFSHLKQENRKGKSLEGWVQVAEELAEEHDGLPCGNRLRKSGCSGLVRMIKKYPGAFVHIPRKRDVPCA